MQTSHRDPLPAERHADFEEHTLITPLGPTETLEAARVAARTADVGLGVDTLLIDVGPVLAVTDYFVITSGENARQVKAIVDAIEESVAHECDRKPLRVEGLDSLEWVLLDYGPFVVHVFAAEQRAFYKLERLWSDCPRLALR